MTNPFFYGNAVPQDQFLGRRREVRRIVGRITSGQSTAIVGEPRVGKTSLLAYLSAPETHSALYGEASSNFTFSFVDVHTLGTHFGQAEFWTCALEPLQTIIEQDTALKATHARCVENQFGGFVLGQFFTHLGRSGHRLVLLLDEFDALLHHPILNSAEFFGSLRSVATRSRGLSLVVASRRTLTNLNADAFGFSQGGSPYFNFFSEIMLGPLTQKDTNTLLDRGRERFSAEDRRFIAAIAGGHPYLVQVAASALWEAGEEEETSPDERRLATAEALYNEAAHTLGETWHAWSPVTQQVFGSIASAHLHTLAKQGACSNVIVPQTTTASKTLSLEERNTLYQLMTECYNINELQTLCFRLGIDYEELHKRGKQTIVTELIRYAERHKHLEALLLQCQKNYPHEKWPGITLTQTTATFSLIQPQDLTRNFSQELRILKQQGFIAQDATVPGGYRVRPLVFLWWLTDAAGLLPTGARPLMEAVARRA